MKNTNNEFFITILVVLFISLSLHYQIYQNHKELIRIEMELKSKSDDRTRQASQDYRWTSFLQANPQLELPEFMTTLKRARGLK